GALSGSRHGICPGLRKAPRAVRDEPLRALALVLPIALANGAAVHMGLTDQQFLAPGTLRTGPGRHIRKIPRCRVMNRNLTGERRRSRMLPAVAGGAAMRMSPLSFRGARRAGLPSLLRPPWEAKDHVHLINGWSGVALAAHPRCRGSAGAPAGKLSAHP